MGPRQTCKRHSSARHAFTLVEVLVCAVLLAIGFVALIAAYGHDTIITQRGEDLTLAAFLANEIRDMALQMPLADVLGMDGMVAAPAIASANLPPTSMCAISGSLQAGCVTCA